jgi:hypothetical protein
LGAPLKISKLEIIYCWQLILLFSLNLIIFFFFK